MIERDRLVIGIVGFRRIEPLPVVRYEPVKRVLCQLRSHDVRYYMNYCDRCVSDEQKARLNEVVLLHNIHVREYRQGGYNGMHVWFENAFAMDKWIQDNTYVEMERNFRVRVLDMNRD